MRSSSSGVRSVLPSLTITSSNSWSDAAARARATKSSTSSSSLYTGATTLSSVGVRSGLSDTIVAISERLPDSAAVHLRLAPRAADEFIVHPVRGCLPTAAQPTGHPPAYRDRHIG